MKMRSPVSTYAFVNAKLRARISTLLDEQFYLGIARSRSFVEAVGMLQNTKYAAAADVYTRTGDVKLCELEIVRLEWETLSMLRKHIPNAVLSFSDAVLRRYEIAIVKHAVRLWFERVIRGRSIDDKVPYLLRDDAAHGIAVDAIVNAGSTEQITALLSGYPYAEPLGKRLAELPETGSLYAAEIALDRWYYDQLFAALKTLDSRDERIARSLLGVEIDTQNVAWLIRIRRYRGTIRFEDSVLPGGRLIAARDLKSAYESERPLDTIIASLGPRVGVLSGSGAQEEESGGEIRRLSLLEEMLRAVLDHDIRRTLGGNPFTIGTILAYIMLLQHEIQTLISVLNAKYYDLPSERIEGLL